jgi:hypothetical protein
MDILLPPGPNFLEHVDKRLSGILRAFVLILPLQALGVSRNPGTPQPGKILVSHRPIREQWFGDRPFAENSDGFVAGIFAQTLQEDTNIGALSLQILEIGSVAVKQHSGQPVSLVLETSFLQKFKEVVLRQPDCGRTAIDRVRQACQLFVRCAHAFQSADPAKTLICDSDSGRFSWANDAGGGRRAPPPARTASQMPTLEAHLRERPASPVVTRPLSQRGY